MTASRRSINLALQLSAYINENKLHHNAGLYPEMKQTLSSEQQRKIGLIMNTLLELPLIHATREPFPEGRNMQPSIDLPHDHPGHTLGLDRSLGLDRYVFFIGDYQKNHLTEGIFS